MWKVDTQIRDRNDYFNDLSRRGCMHASCKLRKQMLAYLHRYRLDLIMDNEKRAYLVPSVEMEPTSKMLLSGKASNDDADADADDGVILFSLEQEDGSRLVALVVQKEQRLNFANSKRFAPNFTQSPFYARRSGLTINPKANICLVNKPSRALHSFPLSAPSPGMLSTKFKICNENY
ncbi:hypothetical protein T12_16596 [Trichinella patagoniensis]|uniref:Uncharacterized protein n=1 Tax=Trichinella patagoniensis TaxID=990121 RepID=A0A0V1AG77_9BILA|nr:hypothetical protein T12_16596 [Trichinella patagoniensis]